MATININPPAKISRNTAADGDFLWKQDFEVLYNNDIALKNAIEQGTKELTPSSGINIDADKNITVNKGKGLKFNGNALEVDITGDGGTNVTFDGDKIVVSGYDPTELIHNVSELEDSLDVFSESLEELEKEAITSADNMQPGTQYVYTTNGWEPIAGGGSKTISYWRPTYNSSTGKIEWEMQPSPSMVTPLPSDDLRGSNGKTPEFKIDTDNKWYWKYTDDPDVPASWHNTNTSATGPRGATGETGPQGFSIELDSVETVPGGKEITLKWGDPESPSTSAFVIPSGDKGGQGDPGIKGPDGYTPSVSAESFEDAIGIGQKYTFYWPAAAGKEDLVSKIYHGNTPTVISSPIAPNPTSEHPKGGSAYNIRTKINGTEYDHIINIWHGNDGDATTVKFDTATGHTMSGNGGDSYPYGVNTNVIATQDWVGDQGFITKDTDDLTYYYKKTETSAREELTAEFANKVDIPINLGGMYLVLRTNANGTVSGWSDLSDYCYSKSSAKNTFIQQSFIDNTLSGTGANAGNKLGVNTNAIPTKDWLDNNYLPLSGGTVSGETVISGSSNFDLSNLKFTRESQTNIGRIGLNQSGGLSIKSSDSTNNNYTQINISPTGDNDKRIALQKRVNDVASAIGYLIPATIENAGWSPSEDDKILHIVLES